MLIMTRSCSIIAGPAPYAWSCLTIELSLVPLVLLHNRKEPAPHAWSCFTIKHSLVPLFWSCFTIEKNSTSLALKYEQDLAAIINPLPLPRPTLVLGK